jgi:hypothetical protein
VPELAAYLNDDSDDEYQADANESNENPAKPARQSSGKKAPRQPKESSEQDEETVEIIKKFRHVQVPSEKKPRRKSQASESTTISAKNRPDELYVVFNEDSSRTIMSGSQLQVKDHGKKSSPIQSFHFHQRPTKLNTVEDLKAPWRCILCWKEPYEDYLGPLFGAHPLNEQCQMQLNNSSSFVFTSLIRDVLGLF